MYRNAYIYGKIMKKSKGMLRIQFRIMVHSEREGERCVPGRANIGFKILTLSYLVSRVGEHIDIPLLNSFK